MNAGFVKIVIKKRTSTPGMSKPNAWIPTIAAVAGIA
jgi:hypothetical protein